MRGAHYWLAPAVLALLAAAPGMVRAAQPGSGDAAKATPAASATQLPPGTRSGREIYRLFREGLGDEQCRPDSASPRWRKHFSVAPERLASGEDNMLALFGYVVDAVREASLPTEYALIPFVESGYDPSARSSGGPTGMWQFIKLTARAHKIEIRPGYDGRLSPIDSTRAAVRYLKTLHGMFAGDWRLASMAYNAGEYRLFSALRKSGQEARDADYDKLAGLPGITRAYPRKIHALSCLLQRADDRQAWLERLDRPVPILTAVTLSDADTRIDAWSMENDANARQLRRLNPVYRSGRIAPPRNKPRQLLAPLALTLDDVPVDAAAAGNPSAVAGPTGRVGVWQAN